MYEQNPHECAGEALSCAHLCRAVSSLDPVACARGGADLARRPVLSGNGTARQVASQARTFTFFGLRRSRHRRMGRWVQLRSTRRLRLCWPVPALSRSRRVSYRPGWGDAAAGSLDWLACLLECPATAPARRNDGFCSRGGQLCGPDWAGDLSRASAEIDRWGRPWRFRVMGTCPCTTRLLFSGEASFVSLGLSASSSPCRPLGTGSRDSTRE